MGITLRNWVGKMGIKAVDGMGIDEMGSYQVFYAMLHVEFR